MTATQINHDTIIVRLAWMALGTEPALVPSHGVEGLTILSRGLTHLPDPSVLQHCSACFQSMLARSAQSKRQALQIYWLLVSPEIELNNLPHSWLLHHIFPAIGLVAVQSLCSQRLPKCSMLKPTLALRTRNPQNFCEVLGRCVTAFIIFSLYIFSFVWLQLIYLGPLGEESCRLVDYLQAQPGVSALPPGHNPATWMLEVTGGAMATSSRAAPLDFAAIYQVCPPSLTRRAEQALQ